jgi:putative oxidoreductase
MSILFAIGRVLLALPFVLSGASKLWDVAGTAAIVAAKFTVPAFAAGLAAQAETATGMQTPQLLTILFGVVEILAALMLIFNFGTRLGALALIVLVAVATFYVHDFWNQTGSGRIDNLFHALKNLSLVGGLLVFFALGSWRPLSEREEELYPRHDHVLREEALPPQ